MKKLLFFLLTAALALPMTAQRTALTKSERSFDRDEVVTSSPLQIKGWNTSPSVKLNRAGTISWDFETQAEIDEWTIIDNDGDGYAWESLENSGYYTYAYSGEVCMISRSYNSGTVLYPDNWLISPVVPLNGELLLHARNANAQWPDQFAVYACVGEGSNPEDFVMISDGDIAPGSTWESLTFDLTAFAGQQGRIAIVHHNCYDDLYIMIDDISITVPVPMPENVEAVPGSTDASIYWADDNNVAWNLRYRLNDPNNKLWDFEDAEAEDNSLPGGWTSIDADGDGYEWYHLNNGSSYNNHGGFGHVTSASYAGTALNPDNWLVSPQLKLFGELSLWINAQDPEWPDEVFAIYVSTGDPTDTTTFVRISDVLVANGVPTEYVYDMSEYDGAMGYVAVRHFGCTDNFRLNVDDVAIGHPWIYVNDLPNTNYVIDELTPETTYDVQVQGVDGDGFLSDWTESLVFTTEAAPVIIPDVYLLGQVNDQGWAPNVGTLMTYDAENKIYTATVNLDANESFGFTTELAEYDDQGSWDYIEPFRFGPESSGDFVLQDVYIGVPLDLTFDTYGAIKVLSTAEYKITVSLEGDGYIMVEKVTPEPPVGLRGDVNNDHEIDINDVTLLIDVVLGVNVEYSAYGADCNIDGGDGTTAINDVTALINRVLTGEWDD